MAPNGARRIFVPTDPDLDNILCRKDLDVENFHFFHLLDPKFLDFQVLRFPKSGLGRAWGLGPGLGRVGPRVGQAWALGRQTSLPCIHWWANKKSRHAKGFLSVFAISLPSTDKMAVLGNEITCLLIYVNGEDYPCGSNVNSSLGALSGTCIWI